MTITVTVPSEQPSDERAVWTTPEVVTMAAGDAENAAGNRGDNPITVS